MPPTMQAEIPSSHRQAKSSWGGGRDLSRGELERFIGMLETLQGTPFSFLQSITLRLCDSVAHINSFLQGFPIK